MVLFDLIGSVVDDHGCVPRLLTAACLRAGVLASLEVTQLQWNFGSSVSEILDRAISHSIPNNPFQFETLSRSIRSDFFRRVQDFLASADEIRPIPGASLVFAELQSEGIRVVVGSRLDEMTRIRLLDRFGWARDGLIDAHVSIENDHIPETFSTAIDQAAHRCSVPETALIAKVSTTPTAVQTGRTTRCHWIIAALFGPVPRHEFDRHGPTHFVTSLGELPEILLDRTLV